MNKSLVSVLVAYEFDIWLLDEELEKGRIDSFYGFHNHQVLLALCCLDLPFVEVDAYLVWSLSWNLLTDFRLEETQRAFDLLVQGELEDELFIDFVLIPPLSI